MPFCSVTFAISLIKRWGPHPSAESCLAFKSIECSRSDTERLPGLGDKGLSEPSCHAVKMWSGLRKR